jgi:hypothetical protein
VRRQSGQPAVALCSPRPRPVRKQFASSPRPCPQPVHDHVLATPAAASVVSPCLRSCPGHDRPHPARFLELSVSVSSPHPRRVHLRLRVNRPSIVWLAARRQGKTPPLSYENILTMLAAPRDKWRLRIHAGSVAAGWPGTSYEKWRGRLADVPQPVQELGHGWFTARTRTRSALAGVYKLSTSILVEFLFAANTTATFSTCAPREEALYYLV